MKNVWNAATDRAIAESLIRGEEQALATIMRDLGDDLRNHAYKFVRARDAAEDIVQDVLCKLWIQRSEWEVRDSLRGYLYNAVRNRALDTLAHQAVEDSTTSSVHDVLYDSPLQHGAWSDPDRGLAQSGLRNKIQNVLDALHPRVQAAVLFRIDYGLRYAQIAQMLNMSVDTVRQHLMKFRNLLRAALSE